MRLLRIFVIIAASLLLANNAFSNSGGLRLVRDVTFEQENRLESRSPFLSGGMERESEGIWTCRNADPATMNAVGWRIALNQDKALPILLAAESQYEGDRILYPSSKYSVYADVQYMDGTMEWSVCAFFNGSMPLEDESWESAQTTFFPQKAVRSVTLYCMFRGVDGSVRFRNPVLKVAEDNGNDFFIFDGTRVYRDDVRKSSEEDFMAVKPSFYIRDIAADSDWQTVKKTGKGFRISTDGDDISIKSLSRKDRCAVLVVAFPVPDGTEHFFEGLDGRPAVASDEMLTAWNTGAGMGKLSRLPIFGVSNGEKESWLGIDMSAPAVYRLFYNAVTNELCAAFDLGFVNGNSKWKLKLWRHSQPAGEGMRGAWEQYIRTYPEFFEVRTPFMGNWMPFAATSRVKDPEDFCFAFKESDMGFAFKDNSYPAEVPWDDAHGLLSFRYTEPLTWWMHWRLPDGLDAKSSDIQDILAAGATEARRQAAEYGEQAASWEKSVAYDAQQRPFGYYRDTPWCTGVAWSICDLPGLSRMKGNGISSFEYKWDKAYREAVYPQSDSAVTVVPCEGLDGEYIDSIEGYITADLDFRKEHLLYAEAPLTFSLADRMPAIYKGLVSFEYARAISGEVHKAGKLTMANATPSRFPWLVPYLDAMGTETNWCMKGRWSPPTIEEMQFHRQLCCGKPYCFLQNTDFNHFTHEMVEKYMMRSLAFAFFPGFFSADAASRHYFYSPEYYERDRDLFKKYLPLCKMLAEAEWEPVTGVRASSKGLCLERFGKPGNGFYYLTVFNPTDSVLSVELTFADGNEGKTLQVLEGDMELEPEHVLVVKVTEN